MFTPISAPDALFGMLFIVQVILGVLFLGLLWAAHKRQRQQPWHTVVPAPPKNHLRDRCGFITPELASAIAGIGLMLLLGLIMAACFADEPRW